VAEGAREPYPTTYAGARDTDRAVSDINKILNAHLSILAITYIVNSKHRKTLEALLSEPARVKVVVASFMQPTAE